MTARVNRRLYDIIYRLHNWKTETVNTRTVPAPRAPVDFLLEMTKRDVSGPAITSRDITDYGNVDFVADPFLHKNGDDIHMLFEVYNRDRDPTASIGHAISRDGGEQWEYDQIVFETDRHVSFPFIFEHDSEVYFVPDLSNSPERKPPVVLYRFDEFPHEYSEVATIVDGDYTYMDTVVFRHSGRWWAVAGSGDNNRICLYHNETLTEGNWQPHPSNPVVTDRKCAGRPGGRPIVGDETLVMFYQDCVIDYGNALRAYEIKELSPTTYVDEQIFEEPILHGSGGRGWNSGRMHHLDLQFDENQALIAADGDIGFGRSVSHAMWSIGFDSIPLA